MMTRTVLLVIFLFFSYEFAFSLSSSDEKLVIDLREVRNWDSINSIDFSDYRKVQIIGYKIDSFEYNRLSNVEYLDLENINNAICINLSQNFRNLQSIKVIGSNGKINYGNLSELYNLERIEIEDLNAYKTLNDLNLSKLSSLILEGDKNLMSAINIGVCSFPAKLQMLGVYGEKHSLQLFLDWFYFNHSSESLLLGYNCEAIIKDWYIVEKIIIRGFPNIKMQIESNSVNCVVIQTRNIQKKKLKWLLRQRGELQFAVGYNGDIGKRALKMGSKFSKDNVQFILIYDSFHHPMKQGIFPTSEMSRDQWNNFRGY